jgi:hypothetical protein
VGVDTDVAEAGGVDVAAEELLRPALKRSTSAEAARAIPDAAAAAAARARRASLDSMAFGDILRRESF